MISIILIIAAIAYGCWTVRTPYYPSSHGVFFVLVLFGFFAFLEYAS